ncbi:MAG: shikimate kinase [Pseudomonadota bacterium]
MAVGSRDSLLESRNQRDSAAADLMARVGQRVRAARAARGMTRRQLAQDADLSERYLAEIENGKANLSLQLLCRAADALGLDPLVLLREKEDHDTSDLTRYLAGLDGDQQAEALDILRSHFDSQAAEEATIGVALIGLRGAGKSTLGQALAQRLGCPFLCLTDIIQERGGMGVEEIFSLGGQQLYRRLERAALEQVIAGGGPLVLEIGGSLVSEAETFARLRASFHTIWLQASPQEHMSRVMAQGDFRPMDGNRGAMEDLRRILAARTPLYAAAHARLDTSGRKLEESLESLVAMSQSHLAVSPKAAAGTPSFAGP